MLMQTQVFGKKGKLSSEEKILDSFFLVLSNKTNFREKFENVHNAQRLLTITVQVVNSFL